MTLIYINATDTVGQAQKINQNLSYEEKSIIATGEFKDFLEFFKVMSSLGLSAFPVKFGYNDQIH